MIKLIFSLLFSFFVVDKIIAKQKENHSETEEIELNLDLGVFIIKDFYPEDQCKILLKRPFNH